MKKLRKFAVTMLALAVVSIAVSVFAGTVYERPAAITVGPSGAGVWTNGYSVAALDIQRIWVENNLLATNVVTFTRITADGLYTQAIGTVTCSGGSGSTATFTAEYLAYGDKIAWVSWKGTNCVIIPEFLFQQH